MRKKISVEFYKCPLNKHTFKVRDMRNFVIDNVTGYTLNLFCGPTVLDINSCRNDVDDSIKADFHKDAFDFFNIYPGPIFDSVILDPPYSYRKSMEFYKGHKNSRFKLVKDALIPFLRVGGAVITFGYQSISMGVKRGFNLEKVAIFNHGGAIHDTIACVERRVK